MKAATVTQIKKELAHHSQKELIEYCLTLSKFKKENKELLTYLLFETDEDSFISSVNSEVSEQFEEINTKTYYYIKKSTRKILRNIKKHIRYSKKTETEIELLLHFLSELRNMSKSYKRNVTLQNIFDRQVLLIKKAITKLHEDLQYDYNMELEELLDA